MKPISRVFGVLSALAIAACVLVSACAQPAAPSPQPSAPPGAAFPSFAGAWTGVYEITSCSRSQTEDFMQYCPSLPWITITSKFSFEFTQTANVVTGRASKPHPSDPPAPVVTGTIDASGELVVTERIVDDHEAIDGYTRTKDTTWRLKRSPDGGLVGTLFVRYDGSGKQPGWAQYEGVIRSAARVN